MIKILIVLFALLALCLAFSSPVDAPTPVCWGRPADSSDVCSGHGICNIDSLCYCDIGWAGERCECKYDPNRVAGYCSE